MAEATPSASRPTTVRLQRISRAFIESAALQAAIELELFTATERSGLLADALDRRIELAQVEATP